MTERPVRARKRTEALRKEGGALGFPDTGSSKLGHPRFPEAVTNRREHSSGPEHSLFLPKGTGTRWGPESQGTGAGGLTRAAPCPLTRVECAARVAAHQHSAGSVTHKACVFA